jgi:hypothetical protein
MDVTTALSLNLHSKAKQVKLGKGNFSLGRLFIQYKQDPIV